MAGTVEVMNNVIYVGQPKTILAKVAGQNQQIAPDETYTFQNVPVGKQNFTVQVDPAITGLQTGYQTVNISNDFSNFMYKISLDGHEWKMQAVMS
jgi:hypothetical protein